MHRRGLVLSGAGTTETEFAYRPDDTDWFDDTVSESYRLSAEVIIQYRGAVDDDTEFSHGIVARFLVGF